MKPEKHRDRSRRASAARVRMYLKAHLGWIHGFPRGQAPGRVEWTCFPHLGSPAEHVGIDRQRLSQAQFALTRLVHRFPSALPHVVGDVDDWRRRVEQLLGALKQAVHEGRPLAGVLADISLEPPRGFAALAERLVHSSPPLGAVAAALSWSVLLRPDQAQAALAWIAHEQQALAALPARMGEARALSLVLALTEIVRSDGERRVEALLRVFSDPRSFTVPIGGLQAHAGEWAACFRKWRDDGVMPKRPVRPQVELGEKTVELVEWAALQERLPRRQALDLFAALALRLPLDEWEQAWTALEEDAANAVRRLKTLAPLPVQFQGVAHQLAGEFEDRAFSRLPQLRSGLLVDEIKTVCRPENETLVAATIRTLAAFPQQGDQAALRPAVFYRWAPRMMDLDARSSLLQFLRAWRLPAASKPARAAQALAPDAGNLERRHPATALLRLQSGRRGAGSSRRALDGNVFRGPRGADRARGLPGRVAPTDRRVARGRGR